MHWKPPSQAMDAVIASAGDHSLNQYGSGAGLPDLVETLKQKLVAQNGLEQVHVFDRTARKRKVYAIRRHSQSLGTENQPGVHV